MKRIALTGLALAAVTAAGSGGYWAGLRGMPMPGADFLAPARPAAAESVATGAVIYYRDPDGRPVYSATPRGTDDGRDFRVVRASEDVSFEEKPAPAVSSDPPAGERRILYYRNPMGLPDTSPVPKKDSMGMDYIPVYDGEAADGSSVKVSPGRLQRTGVKTEFAAQRTISRPIRVPGQVQIDERRVSIVATRTDAFVEHVGSVTTGDRVSKGDPLVMLHAPEIAAAGAQYLTDLRSGVRSGAAGGARQRLQNLGVPAEAIAEIERTRQVPIAVTWTAPRDGVVLERNVVDGMKASPGDVLFRVADTSTVWVIADVPEYEIGSIRVGAPATIRVRSRPGTIFDGRISLLYPQVDEATRTTRVRIEIANPDGVLLPSMYADVEIGAGDGEPVVAVPDSAVIDTGARQVVILDRGEGRFEPREVKTGIRGAGFTEIRDGIRDGDRVVVAANFLIDAESNLKAALGAMVTAEPKL